MRRVSAQQFLAFCVIFTKVASLNSASVQIRAPYLVSMSRLRAISLPLAATVLAWGFNFAAIKLLYQAMPPPAVGLLRYIPMALCLAAICVYSREELKYPKGQIGKILLIGFISMGVYMVLFLEGIARVAPAEGAIVLATAPVFTALFSVLMGQEPFRIGVLIGALISIAGVGCVVSNGIIACDVDPQTHVAGVLMILASAAVWAYQAVLSKPLMAGMSSLKLLTLSMPGAAIVLVPYGVKSVAEMNWAAMDSLNWGLFFHVTFLAGVVGFWGFYAGVRAIGASRALLYQFFVPPIAVTFDIAIFDRQFHWLQFVGLAVIIGGVSIAARARAAATLPSIPRVSTLTE